MCPLPEVGGKGIIALARTMRSGIVAALLIASSCTCTSRSLSGVRAPAAAREVRVVGWTDFPKSDKRTRELSGLAWNSERGSLFAISDELPWIVSLTPSRDWTAWQLGT